MVISMTGYGRSEIQSLQYSITVEVRTVNHRFCEFQIRLPRQLMRMEDKIKKQLSEFIRRGRVEVFVTIAGESLTERKFEVDWKLLENYHHLLKEIQAKFTMEANIDIQSLVQREEIIVVSENEKGNDEIEKLLLTAVKEAGIKIKEMREIEGTILLKDLQQQLHNFATIIKELKTHAPNVMKQYEEKLLKKLEEHLDGKVDESRILTEAALFAEKADINEELIRLQSHVFQFNETLKFQEPIGRKLDFILQEMNREVNTIGSKANDSTIAKQVVEMKSLLEKMREQVQNIE